ncbi:hypothetical protein [Pseudaestuariivita rosea]|uniref:hypothetical protein n=1 Tax=Pseudaestuariivita rosea TaxID=2763263 RepID=UPI001ABA8381|nr:hypothetical protein [Pseudaestuariivita rosea]
MLDEARSHVLEDISKSIYALDTDASNPAVIESNLEFMHGLAKAGMPRLILKELVQSKADLVEIAARSYEHVNHFTKVVLVDNANTNGYRLTLHVWTRAQAEEAQKEELIHDHRFSFWSHIVCGNMRSENFHEAEEPSYERKDFRRYIYRPTQTGNIHSCEFDANAQLIREPDKIVPQGDVYYLSYTTTHRVVFPTEHPCLCTLVLRGPRERNHCFTYNTFYPKRGMDSSVPMMSPRELKDKLEFVLECIQ